MSKTTYVAFLRGIGPGNPNMHNDKLRAVFESLGYEQVRSVISSGNIIFETEASTPSVLESTIEAELLAKLDIRSTTIIRSSEELRAFAARQPFRGRTHSQNDYLMVTFLKQRNAKFKHSDFTGSSEDFTFITFDTNIQAVCYAVDMHSTKAPRFLNWLESHFHKAITGRTWKTIERIVARL
jgi:uncharacterized protein (DUF1697 family)